jgi:NAD(P)-dependent dehydrogenase (short-subunit alcohol dehydrogenase family)
VILGEVREVGSALAAALTSADLRVRQVAPGTALRSLSATRFEADLSSPEGLRELHQRLSGPEEHLVGCVINLLGLTRSAADDLNAPQRISEWTFNCVKEFADDLCATAEEGGGRFVNVTGLDGQLGLAGGSEAGLAGAGTLGITKTLGREHPELLVKNVDIDPTLEPHIVSTRLLQELEAGDDLVEIGLNREGRWRLQLRTEPVPAALSPLPIDANSVVLVTGGAAGITADAARALAAAAPCRLILIGRSPAPKPEDPETAGLDGASLRQRLIVLARQHDQRIIPAEIERSLNRILKDRHMRDTLEVCRAGGARVEYHALDVRDPEKFGGLIDDLYRRFGRLDGVVHGAGVIEDKRIGDKTPESFARVFATKAASALTLARKLRPESLKFLVFFSSVSGRFGNAGQADYSAANEFLNKLAGRLSHRWPARVVSLNWGPWDGGMISDTLRGMYAAAGVRLIGIEDGVRAFVSELRLPQRQGPEVVLSHSVEQMAGALMGVTG